MVSIHRVFPVVGMQFMFGLMMVLGIQGMLLGRPVEVVRVHPQEPMVQRQVNLQVLLNRKEVFLPWE